MDNTERFDSVLYGVCPRLRAILRLLPESVRNRTQEIRLRRGLPLTLTVDGGTLFVRDGGQTSPFIVKDLATAMEKDLAESFRLLCHGSAYAHTTELKQGFIMMSHGHRAGICGICGAGGMIRDISSINIRIAREMIGAADGLVTRYTGGGLLIAGPPGSGKTTLLRDFVRQLSDGVTGRYLRACVIDNRGELAGSHNGQSVNDLGKNTDVLMTKDKASGIEMALRTMFPDIIAFDEIGTAAELSGVHESFNAGVQVVTTAHISDEDDLMRRSVTAGLLRGGAIGTVAILGTKVGGEIRFFDKKELCSDLVS